MARCPLPKCRKVVPSNEWAAYRMCEDCWVDRVYGRRSGNQPTPGTDLPPPEYKLKKTGKFSVVTPKRLPRLFG